MTREKSAYHLQSDSFLYVSCPLSRLLCRHNTSILLLFEYVHTVQYHPMVDQEHDKLSLLFLDSFFSLSCCVIIMIFMIFTPDTPSCKKGPNNGAILKTQVSYGH